MIQIITKKKILQMKMIVKKQILHWLQQILLRFHYEFHYEIKITNTYPDTTTWQKSSICQVENKFLLLLSPVSSGSTAISEFICQSNKVHGLLPGCEGLRLLYEIWVHEVCTPHLYINYKSLTGMLAQKINKLEQAYPEMEYIFDKTPDTACRYKSLLKIIPNTKVVANNRNPYAQIASALKRRHFTLRCPNPHDPLERCRMCIHFWLVWSEYIRDACEKDNVPLVTYEQFCDNPHTLISAFGLEESEFKKDFHVSNVKKYAPKAIENMNEKQIALLSDLQKETITEALSEHKELLAYFGYELMH